MASIRKHYKKYQVLIRRKGHPLICKSFATYSDATKYAQDSESNIAKGLYADLSEANQTLLRDALQRYKDEVTAKQLLIKSLRRKKALSKKHIRLINLCVTRSAITA